MSSSQKLTLEMTFPVTNELIKSFSKSCCEWGQRKPPYDFEGQIRGKQINKVKLIDKAAPLRFGSTLVAHSTRFSSFYP
jgi:hypothetical protein